MDDPLAAHSHHAMDLFSAYRRTFATFDPDELVVWWYCGFVLSTRDGLGSVPITQAETIMVYRTRDVDADTFTIDWTEVGAFRNITTGEQMEGWFNPFIGALVPYPKSFVDGPATFTVTRSGEEGVEVALVQHNARVEGVRLDFSFNDKTIGIRQTESKTRTFHRPDGSLPPVDGPDATQIDTVLSVWADLDTIRDPGRPNVAAHGFYTSGSRGGGSGSWASTQVQGAMQKARVDERLNPVAWNRLQQFYPRFFDGDRIDPDWD